MPSAASSDLSAAEARAIFEAWYFDWLTLPFGSPEWNLAIVYYGWDHSNGAESLKSLSRHAESEGHMIAFVKYALPLRLLGVSK